MPLIALLVALAFPRLIIFLLWLLTGWFASIDLIVGVLGFFFMPYTLLWVSVVLNWYGGVWGMLQMIFLVVAVAVDFSHLFAGWRFTTVEE